VDAQCLLAELEAAVNAHGGLERMKALGWGEHADDNLRNRLEETEKSVISLIGLEVFFQLIEMNAADG
jgi:flavorubredoxin